MAATNRRGAAAGRKQLVEWHNREYLSSLALDQVEGDRSFHRWLRTLDPTLSGRRRNQTITALKYEFPTRRRGSACIQLIAERPGVTARPRLGEREGAPARAVFAAAYWWPGDATPEYVCLSPTYDSCDGEYRHRVTAYPTFDETFGLHQEIADSVEEFILEQLRAGALVLSAKYYTAAGTDDAAGAVGGRGVDTIDGLDRAESDDDIVVVGGDGTLSDEGCGGWDDPWGDSWGYVEGGAEAADPPPDVTDVPELADAVDRLRLPVRAYVAAWICDFYNIFYGLMQAHSTPAYSAVLRGPTDGEFFQRLIDRGCLRALLGLRARWTRSLDVGDTRLEVGLKSVPLTERGLAAAGDVRYRAWREIYLQIVVSDLVANFVCGGFPVFGAWFIQQGTPAVYYENHAMHAKYARGRRAAEVVAQLDAARAEKLGAEFDDDIARAERYANSFLVMADASLVCFSEFVGTTVANMPSRLQNLQEYAISPKEADLYRDSELFTKILFDICYACYTLHARAGAVHADLHMNNMTVNRVVYYSQQTRLPDDLAAYVADPADFVELRSDPLAAYVLRDARDTFVFPTDGRVGTLIDFSRAIIGGPGVERLRADFGDAYTEAYLRDQRGRALAALRRNLPAYVDRYEDDLRRLIRDDFPLVFKLLGAVDLLAVGRGLAGQAEGEARAEAAAVAAGWTPDTHAPRPGHPGEPLAGAVRTLGPWKEAAALAHSLEEAARDWLVRGLDRARAGDVADASVEWPGLEILPKVFAKWTYSAWKRDRPKRLRSGQLSDVYNAGAPLQWSLREYARWPPAMQVENIEKVRGEIPLRVLISRDPADAIARDAPVAGTSGELTDIDVGEHE